MVPKDAHEQTLHLAEEAMTKAKPKVAIDFDAIKLPCPAAGGSQLGRVNRTYCQGSKVSKDQTRSASPRIDTT